MLRLFGSAPFIKASIHLIILKINDSFKISINNDKIIKIC